MVHRVMASSPVRPLFLSKINARWVVPILLLATFAGCGHHRRSAMRPVYGTPIPATTVPSCPTPGIGVGTGVGSAPSSTITAEPDSSDLFLSPAGGSPSSVGNGPDGVSRTGGSPPLPNAADDMEPGMNSSPNIPPIRPTPPSSGRTELNAPTAFRSVGRSASMPRRTSRVVLRDAVAPYLADPNDLFQPSRADRPWKYVVLHHSANAKGSLDQIDRDHRKVLGFEGCGYHFVIGNGTDSPDGQIEIADRWNNQKGGVHCRNGKTPEVNEYGIGICLVGNFDQAAPTPKQIAAARTLVAYLADRYSIAGDHLGTHDRFANGPTDCPGKNFPGDAILGSRNMASR